MLLKILRWNNSPKIQIRKSKQYLKTIKNKMTKVQIDQMDNFQAIQKEIIIRTRNTISIAETRMIEIKI